MAPGDFVARYGGEKIWGRRFSWHRGYALLFANGAEASECNLRSAVSVRSIAGNQLSLISVLNINQVGS